MGTDRVHSEIELSFRRSLIMSLSRVESVNTFLRNKSISNWNDEDERKANLLSFTSKNRGKWRKPTWSPAPSHCTFRRLVSAIIYLIRIRQWSFDSHSVAGALLADFNKISILSRNETKAKVVYFSRTTAASHFHLISRDFHDLFSFFRNFLTPHGNSIDYNCQRKSKLW